MARSQRAFRYREGADYAGVTAYSRGEDSQKTEAAQRLAAIRNMSVASNATEGKLPTSWVTVVPVVTGLLAVGSTLTSTTGTWGASNTSNTLTWQWRVNRTPRAGATLSTYVLTANDLGKYVDCLIRSVDQYGTRFGPSNLVGPVV